MAEERQIGCFMFEDESTYETAKNEKMVIDAIRKKYDVRNKRVALKIYQKVLKDRSFTTVIGYSFLNELYENLERANVSVNELPHLIIQEENETKKEEKKSHSTSMRNQKEEKWKLLYETQKNFGKKCKIVIVMLIILIAALFVIEYKSQNSIFTYKQKTEQELIDKYEAWEDQLQQRENALNGGTENGTENSSR